MEKKVIYLSVFVCLLELVRTNNVLHLTIDSSACSNYYDLEEYTEAYLTYKGAALGEEECYVKFRNVDAFQTQCIKPQSLQLSCPNTVDVYRRSISTLSPERQFTCTNSPVMYGEWCGSDRTTNLYIVFRTGGGPTYNDNTKLHIYRKPLPTDDDPSDTRTSTRGNVVPAIVVPLVIFVIGLIIVIVYVCVRNSRPQSYNTTERQTYMQTASVPVQPLNRPPQQPPPLLQQQQLPPPQQLPGNYQWHTMQTAYPVPVGQTDTPLMNNQLRQHQCTPSAPPVDETAPPSYESVVSSLR